MQWFPKLGRSLVAVKLHLELWHCARELIGQPNCNACSALHVLVGIAGGGGVGRGGFLRTGASWVFCFFGEMRSGDFVYRGALGGEVVVDPIHLQFLGVELEDSLHVELSACSLLSPVAQLSKEC